MFPGSRRGTSRVASDDSGAGLEVGRGLTSFLFILVAAVLSAIWIVQVRTTTTPLCRWNSLDYEKRKMTLTDHVLVHVIMKFYIGWDLHEVPVSFPRSMTRCSIGSRV
ncbi:hypothetical protein CEXT_152961 [Caerostris extrusa]|uniref:Uncharacterized protein n=1 Tax=Caerostris extrusa TaxID=172846 RepID=A0AAV4NR80_CAEEX|nr:hypothetical protein CEXT_152961 [Caerostris extrusa]